MIPAKRVAGLVLAVSMVSVAVLAAGCTRPSKPLVIPEAKDLEGMYISKHGPGGFTLWTYHLTDPGRIAAILDHLKKHNPDEYRIETRVYAWVVNPRLPDYEYSFSINGDTSMKLAVLIGPDWLGAAHDGVESFPGERRINLYRRRPLGADERATLVRLLEKQPGDRNMLDSNGTGGSSL